MMYQEKSGNPGWYLTPPRHSLLRSEFHQVGATPKNSFYHLFVQKGSAHLFRLDFLPKKVFAMLKFFRLF
jgi:hypothetical protein